MAAPSLVSKANVVGPSAFRSACSRFATGVTVAAVVDRDGQPHGLTINSFTSVSCSPPLVLICIGHASSTLPRFREADCFGVSVLADHQQNVASLFCTRGADRFTEEAVWHRGQHGPPLIAGALAVFECAMRSQIEQGDHAIFIGEVIATEVRNGNPLLYFGSTYRSIARPE